MEILSANFYETPPAEKEYFILVQAPDGGSIYYGGVVLMTDVVDTPFEQL